MADSKPGLVQCLECGRWFRAIGSHLTRVHGMTARQYREHHDLPAGHKLASDDLREAQSHRTRAMIEDGTLRNDPVTASEAARTAGRGNRTAADLARQADIARSIPRKQLPLGAKRADGRDADRARETQRLRRAGIRTSPGPKITPENIAAARTMWFDLSLSRQEVAARLGVRLSTLYRRFGPRGR
ncbi:MucR family transcriptional regulator [Halodurantibacterium flavum]|uniref:MucR family transcriptional regulator n=1 Tax=Halodurantibacterium flavum TaxID=1382802 RepID=A0ABW4S8D3_9RHOB